jgi:hypothetical protein
MSTTFYGAASITPKGRLSRKTSGGFFKTAILMEKLVRLDLAKAQGKSLISDPEICKIIGRSPRYLSILRGKREYLQKRIEVTTGIGLENAESTEFAIQKHKQYLRMLMPDALRVIADTLQQNPIDTVGRRLRTQMALEVLDREGSFPKISRTDSHLKIEHDFSSTDGVSRELLEALGGSAQSPGGGGIIEALEINSKFSHSETLDSEAQEAAMSTLEAMPVETETVQ